MVCNIMQYVIEERCAVTIVSLDRITFRFHHVSHHGNMVTIYSFINIVSSLSFQMSEKQHDAQHSPHPLTVPPFAFATHNEKVLRIFKKLQVAEKKLITSVQ